MLKALGLRDSSLMKNRGRMLVGYREWPKEFADRYREEGCWLGETFGVLRERAEKYGDQIAVVSGKTHVTYSELDKKVDRLAAGLLNLGIKKEDRVVIQLPNIIEFFEICFALFRIGRSCLCTAFTSK